MVGLIIILIIVAITITYLILPKFIQLYKLKKIIDKKYKTKVVFSHKNQIGDTWYYIFNDRRKIYKINQFGNICSVIKRIKN